MMVGGVRSMRIGPSARPTTLPATSLAWPLAKCSTPSVESVTGAEQLAIPLSASSQAKVTVTGALYQPLSLGRLLRSAAIVGAVKSLPSSGGSVVSGGTSPSGGSSPSGGTALSQSATYTNSGTHAPFCAGLFSPFWLRHM